MSEVTVSNLATSVSPVVCSSDEASHESSLHEPHTPLSSVTCLLPRDIEDGLDDADTDCLLDISSVSKEEFLQIHTEVAEQKNLYRRKCVQVSKLSECAKTLSVFCYCCLSVLMINVGILCLNLLYFVAAFNSVQGT